MDDGIGSTLRQARNRRRIDLAEVEATTKIRRRYLRAIEDEEWDALPDGPYARGFIRTYAAYLGLDGERLAEEYRHQVGGETAEQVAPREEAVAAPAPTPRPARRRRGHGAPRLSNRAWTALVSLGLVAVLVAVGLVGGRGGGGGGGGETPRSKTVPGGSRAGRDGRSTAPAAAARSVSVRLTARAEVWVCLLDAGGRKLIAGQVLAAGAEEGPFRSSRFQVAFGNGEVEMSVDGRRAEIPTTASPVGFEIRAGGALRPLSEAERPTCA